MNICRPASGLVVLILIVLAGFARGQTAPVPQPLPFAQDFGTTAFTVLPAGVGAWSGMNGGSITSAASAATSSPTSNATLAGTITIETTGGSYGHAASGNARFYIQTSSSTTNGANQLVLALDTSGWSSVVLSYDVEIISAQQRTVGAVCQYRVGTAGNWTTLIPASGLNPYSQAAGTTGLKTSPQITLPAAAENQSVVQIRWATWRGSDAGNSSGIAVDNLSASGTPIGAMLSAQVTPTSIGEGTGANAATVTVTRTGNLTAPLPVTLAISDPSEAAYDGPNPVAIPAGQDSIAFPIRAVDDAEIDGTQTVTLTASAPSTTTATAVLSVLDDEDANAPPVGFYDATTGLSGAALKATLKVIASPANYQTFSYANTYTPLRSIYQDPANSANVLTVYSGTSVSKLDAYFPGGPSPDVSWSREHVWPESFGLDPANVNPGSTGGDAGPDFTDLFNLRPCLQTVNNQRSNHYYDSTSGTPTIPPLAPQCSRDSDSWEPRDVEKGDLARTIFYMVTRYDGSDPNTMDLEIANTPNTTEGRFANLATLLRWNEDDPVSPEERQRNQNIFANWQHNRNPFIDHPEYVARVWGAVRQSKLATSVSEGGAEDSYTVSLASQPTADVTMTLAHSAPGQMAISPTTLVFTPANWDQPQTIGVTAVDDILHETSLKVMITHSLTSGDPRYAALVPLNVTATVLDNDPVITPASLPISYGGPWDQVPTGFLGSGLGTYSTNLGGDINPGSARFDDTGDRLTIAFTSAPALLTYQLKGNPGIGMATSGTFLVQHSTDGVNFTTLRMITNKDNTDQVFSDVLPLNARFIAFVYADKSSGNLQLDKLSISAASPFQSWASSFGLSGNDADMKADYERDGYANLLDYALGGSPLVNDSAAIRPRIKSSGGNLRLDAIVRSSDPALAVMAEATTDLTDPSSWTSTGVTPVPNVDQSGVSAGFTRVAFDVSSIGGQRFLRLRFTLD